MFGIDDFIVGSLITGGLSYLGQDDTNETNVDISRANSAFNAAEAEKARTFNAAEAQKARDFSRDEASMSWERNVLGLYAQQNFNRSMSDTSYQRAVQDMQRAGLNPMLAYSQGGASTPSSGLPQAHAASPVSASGPAASSAGNPTVLNPMVPGIHSAFQAATTMSDLLTADQNRRIKSPLDRIAESAAELIDKLKENIGPLSQGLSSVVQGIEDKLKAADMSTANAARRVEGALDFLRGQMEDVFKALGSRGGAIAAGAGSAAQAGQRVIEHVQDKMQAAEKKLGQMIHGAPGGVPPPSRGRVPRSAQQPFRWHFGE
ncbi:DNA pilot protein [robinz microvirus RP_96]|nr:DNA pilot protein [robinz microvirus RP_96]